MTILDLPKPKRRYQPTGQTWLIDIYALLPQNVSFLECFWRSHIYFIRYCNKPTEITRNHFCDVFLENQKYLREMFLRRLRDVTEKTSFLKYARDMLETSHKKISFLRCFWDVLKTSKKTPFSRCIWDVLKTSQKDISFEMFLTGSKTFLSMEIWLRSLRDISCRLGYLFVYLFVYLLNFLFIYVSCFDLLQIFEI